MVLLHGWGSTSYMWRFVMPQLAAGGYTVLAPDLRGLGDTAKPATGYDKATVAADIRAHVVVPQPPRQFDFSERILPLRLPPINVGITAATCGG